MLWRGFQRPKRLDFERDTLTDRFGRFYAQPFERGFGTTIGNSLRRVLLSSIEGAAITAVKIDGVPKITGSAQFTDDLFLPRMLYGKILRSPHPHARICSIDISAAAALPGVKAVITGADTAHTAGHEHDAAAEGEADGAVDGVSHCASVPSKCLLR